MLFLSETSPFHRLLSLPFFSYELMADCWKEKPDERPNFTLLRERLEEMMQKDNPYLDFSAVDESKDYYQVPSFNSLMEESTDDLTTDNHRAEGLIEETEKDNEECEKDNLPENTAQLQEKQIRETFQLCKDLSLKNSNSNKDSKDVKISLGDIEMNLYRPGKRGLVF